MVGFERQGALPVGEGGFPVVEVVAVGEADIVQRIGPRWVEFRGALPVRYGLSRAVESALGGAGCEAVVRGGEAGIEPQGVGA